MQIHSIPSEGFLRLEQIIGSKKKNIPPIIPICRTSWLAGVEEGIYPPKIHLGARTVVWRAKDILDFIDKQGNHQDD